MSIRPKPNIDPDNRPFWEAAQNGKFVLMQCKQCNSWYWPAATCRHHPNPPFFQGMEWREASGRGTVFTFNIHRRQAHPAFPVPYVVALIELEEGPMFGTNVVGCAPEDVRVGMPVEIVLNEVEDGVILPQARPA